MNILRHALILGALLVPIFASVTRTEPPLTPPVGPSMVQIPEGKFILGMTEQGIRNFVVTLQRMYGDTTFDADVFNNAIWGKPVRLSAYAIDAAEVTVAQYAEFLNTAGGEQHYHPEMADPGTCGIRQIQGRYEVIPGRANFPVVFVNWFDASAYASWAGKRLPTEAQWEKAARGTTGARFPWGDLLIDRAVNHGRFSLSGDTLDSSDGFLYAAPIGAIEKGRTPSGIYEMSGNVREWTADWYAPDAYQDLTTSSPPGPQQGTKKVVRGGSYRSWGPLLAAIYRDKSDPTAIRDDLGFRCVK